MGGPTRGHAPGFKHRRPRSRPDAPTPAAERTNPGPCPGVQTQTAQVPARRTDTGRAWTNPGAVPRGSDKYGRTNPRVCRGVQHTAGPGPGHARRRQPGTGRRRRGVPVFQTTMSGPTLGPCLGVQRGTYATLPTPSKTASPLAASRAPSTPAPLAPSGPARSRPLRPRPERPRALARR